MLPLPLTNRWSQFTKRFASGIKLQVIKSPKWWEFKLVVSHEISLCIELLCILNSFTFDVARPMSNVIIVWIPKEMCPNKFILNSERNRFYDFLWNCIFSILPLLSMHIGYWVRVIIVLMVTVSSHTLFSSVSVLCMPLFLILSNSAISTAIIMHR